LKGARRERIEEVVSMSPVFKVPRQCPFVLAVEVMHMIGINSLNDVRRATFR
jgi:hypothetical protein